MPTSGTTTLCACVCVVGSVLTLGVGMLRSCHEVNLFLKLKDPAFFDAVVRPFVASKHALEFMDHWVLDHDLKPYTRLDMVSFLLVPHSCCC